MSGYGAVPLSEEEESEPSRYMTWRERLGEKLESQNFHILVLALILIDSFCVAVQIFYTFFHECQVPITITSFNESHGSHSSHGLIVAFEIAEITSIVICCIFLLECALSFVAFGPRFYLPGFPHWKLHLFDVTVVLTTFILEVALRGKDREVAGLLIIFRFWRIIKVVEAVVMGVSLTHREEIERLQEHCEHLETQLAAEKEKNADLTRLLEPK